MTGATRQGVMVTLAVSLMLTTLGSIHAFSVFVVPLEDQFGAPRGLVSLTFSLSLISLTVAVLLGHRLYGRWSPAKFLLGAALLAVAGVVLAAHAPSLAVVWLGYSLCFGGANGLVYGFGMQIVAQANPGKEGLVMGTVSAFYALGSVLAPAPFERLISIAGSGAAMLGLAGTVGLVGLIASFVIARTGMTYRGEVQTRAVQPVPVQWLSLMWLGFFGGVMAGLMVVGHASGIDALFRPGGAAWVAPALLASCNLVGCLVGGRATDLLPPRVALMVFPLVTLLALLGLALMGGVGNVLILIGVIGFAYGAAISAYPPVIAKAVGPEASAKVYGRVFTAWGAAGLVGPWLAGALFDGTGAYTMALYVAAGMAGLSMLAVWNVFRVRG